MCVPENEELRLITFHVKEYINGHSYDAPNIPEIPEIYLSSADMEKICLEENDMVTVYSRTGEHIAMRAKRVPSLKRAGFSKTGSPGDKPADRSTKAPAAEPPMRTLS